MNDLTTNLSLASGWDAADALEEGMSPGDGAQLLQDGSKWMEVKLAALNSNGTDENVERDMADDLTRTRRSHGGHSGASVARAAGLNELESCWPRLDDAALYGLAGKIVRDVDPFTEADPVATLTNILGGFGNLVGRGPHAQVLFDQHPPRLNFVQVGQTSKGRKGTGLSIPKRILSQADCEWGRNHIKSGLSSGEGLIYQVRDEIREQQPIKQKGRVVGYEEVVKDPGVQDKRLLVVEPEFAVVLKMLQREGNSLSCILRQAWDGDTLSPMTKNNRIAATGSHISVLGHITVEELMRYLTETERANGFGNRFTYVLVRRSKCISDPKPVPDSILNPLVEKVQTALSSTKQVKRLARTDSAQEVWDAVYPKLSEGKPGLFGAVIGRAEAQVLRLSVAYALLDFSSVIDVPHLVAALALWEYAESSARLIFGDMIGNPVADAILKALKTTPDGLSRTEINKILGGHRQSTQIQLALDALAQLGVAQAVRVPTKGRDAETWSYVGNREAEKAKKAD